MDDSSVRTLPVIMWLVGFIGLPIYADPPPLPNHSIFGGTGHPSQRSVPYPDGEPGGPAKSVPLGNPFGIEILGESIWITTVDDHCVFRLDAGTHRLERIAGTGVVGYSGDEGPAHRATFNWPHEVRADAERNLFVADTRNHVIRRIDGQTNVVTTVAGNGAPGYAGDGKAGSEVQFKQPHSVVLDAAGGLLVADTGNHRLRRIDLKTGIVETISGTGAGKLPRDGEDARSANLFGPRSLAVDAQSIWIALREGNSVWRIDRATGKIHHVAGTGKKGYSGDGGPPREATFSGPKGIALDNKNRLLVVDTENHAVRRIDLAANRIETLLGGKTLEQNFLLKRPHGIAFATELGYLVADSENHRVLRGHRE